LFLKAAMEATQGFFRHVDLPRSAVYVSAKAAEPATDGSVPPPEEHKRRFADEVGGQHFHLILKAGVNYTAEDVAQAKGKYRCYNCNQPIQGRLYFYPEEFHHQTRVPTCNPIPHCRPECVYRTVQDIPNNADLLQNFCLLYGHDVICAPARFLLNIPGGMTLERYHEAINEKMVIQVQPPDQQCLFANVYVSATMFKDHQLLPSVVSLIEEMTAHSVSNIGPSRERDNSSITVVELPPKKLKQTAMTGMFQMEPASFGRTPDLLHNPHMQDPSRPT
jgi:hypothetical protein